MGRKNRRNPMEYQCGLGFDPRKYIRTEKRSNWPGKRYEQKSVETMIATPKRGEVWFADLGEHTGTSVQDGCRPVVIVSNDIGNAHSDTVNVVPLTRHLKRPELPCHTGLSNANLADSQQTLDDSMVLTEQITTISKCQLRNYVGRIDDPVAMERINRAISEQLALRDISGSERSEQKEQPDRSDRLDQTGSMNYGNNTGG